LRLHPLVDIGSVPAAVADGPGRFTRHSHDTHRYRGLHEPHLELE